MERREQFLWYNGNFSRDFYGSDFAFFFCDSSNCSHPYSQQLSFFLPRARCVLFWNLYIFFREFQWRERESESDSTSTNYARCYLWSTEIQFKFSCSEIFSLFAQARHSQRHEPAIHPIHHYQKKMRARRRRRRHSFHTKESQLKQSKILTGFVLFSLFSASHSALIKISPRFFRLFYGHSFAILSLCSPFRVLYFFLSSFSLNSTHSHHLIYVPRRMKMAKKKNIKFLSSTLLCSDDSSCVFLFYYL